VTEQKLTDGVDQQIRETMLNMTANQPLAITVHTFFWDKKFSSSFHIYTIYFAQSEFLQSCRNSFKE
jgi:hypothetical protein